MNSIYFTDFTFKPKQLTPGISLIDFRTFSSKLKNDFNELIRGSMATAIPEILCGGRENEPIAIQIEQDRRVVANQVEMTDAEIVAFLVQYRADQGTRTLPSIFVGEGIIRFGVFTNRVLTGTVHICQTSLLRKVGETFYIKATPLYHRRVVRVYNLATNRFTDGFLSDQAEIIRFALNTEFDVEENPDVKVRIDVADAHPRNTRFETMAAVIDFDARLNLAMAGFLEINTIIAFEGARPYNLYKLVTT